MKLRLFTALAIGSLLFSCSSDDDNSSASAEITGTYELTAFNIGEAQDLNGDGTASINQLDETNCLNDSFVTLNANNTFSADAKGFDIEFDMNGNPSTIECTDYGVFTGTWARVGNTVTMTYTDEGEEFSDSFTISNNTLQHTITDGEVVGMSGGNPVYVTTDIQFIYTKM